MATVTGFTAERMLVIENTTVVDGEVQGDNLILTTRDGTPIDAGNVRGPTGPQGPMGEVTEAELTAAMASTRVPAGTLTMFAGDDAPAGWLMCNGSAVDRTIYADLFAVLQTKYGVGNGTTTFNLPDLQNRIPAGKGPAAWSDTLNKKAGTKDLIVVSHSHSVPSHTHTGSAWTDSQGDHIHGTRTEGVSGYGYVATPGIAAADGAAGGNYNRWTTNTYQGYPSGNPNMLITDQKGAHGHNVGVSVSTGAASTTGAAGGSATDANLPPFIVVNFIIKA